MTILTIKCLLFSFIVSAAQFQRLFMLKVIRNKINEYRNVNQYVLHFTMKLRNRNLDDQFDFIICKEINDFETENHIKFDKEYQLSSSDKDNYDQFYLDIHLKDHHDIPKYFFIRVKTQNNKQVEVLSQTNNTLVVSSYSVFLYPTDVNSYPDNIIFLKTINAIFNAINVILLFYFGVKLANRNNLELFWNFINFIQLYQLSTRLNMPGFKRSSYMILPSPIFNFSVQDYWSIIEKRLQIQNYYEKIYLFQENNEFINEETMMQFYVFSISFAAVIVVTMVFRKLFLIVFYLFGEKSAKAFGVFYYGLGFLRDKNIYNRIFYLIFNLFIYYFIQFYKKLYFMVQQDISYTGNIVIIEFVSTIVFFLAVLVKSICHIRHKYKEYVNTKKNKDSNENQINGVQYFQAEIDVFFKLMVVSTTSASSHTNYFLFFFGVVNLFVIVPIQYNFKIHQNVWHVNQVNMLTIFVANIALQAISLLYIINQQHSYLALNYLLNSMFLFTMYYNYSQLWKHSQSKLLDLHLRSEQLDERFQNTIRNNIYYNEALSISKKKSNVNLNNNENDNMDESVQARSKSNLNLYQTTRYRKNSHRINIDYNDPNIIQLQQNKQYKQDNEKQRLMNANDDSVIEEQEIKIDQQSVKLEEDKSVLDQDNVDCYSSDSRSSVKDQAELIINPQIASKLENNQRLSKRKSKSRYMNSEEDNHNENENKQINSPDVLVKKRNMNYF